MIGGPLALLLFIPLALLALTFIVVIHELGHFLAAKKAGVKVEEFGIGLPPRAWGKMIGETLYSINWLPLGGFVRLHGETLEEKASDPKRAFNNKPAIPRIVIALAGIFMNLVLALACFTIVYSITGVQTERETDQVKVISVESGSPAQTAGLLPEDIVSKVNKEEITKTDKFISIINDNRGRRVELLILRDGEEKKITVTPRSETAEDQGALGVVISNYVIDTYYPPLWQRPIVGAQKGIESTIMLTKLVLGGFADLSKDVSSGRAPKGVVGPLGLIAVFSEVFKTGFINTINFIGVISLNLAIFNLIPFPPLDGSRVLFVALEKIVGKKALPKIEGFAHSFGMILLLILALVMTGREIPKLIQGGSSGYVESLTK